MSDLDMNDLAAGFARDGYVALQPLFDADKMAEINAELDRYIADVMPTMPVEEVYFENRDDRSTLKQMQKLSVYDAYFRELMENSVIRDLASAAMG